MTIISVIMEASNASGFVRNLLQLLLIIIIFVFVLVATYFTTRFIGKSGMVQTQSKNIKVFETFKIAPNKYIQIIKLGNKFYAISVSKDSIHFLTELSEDQLSIEETEAEQPVAFKELFEKLTSKIASKTASKTRRKK